MGSIKCVGTGPAYSCRYGASLPLPIALESIVLVVVHRFELAAALTVDESEIEFNGRVELTCARRDGCELAAKSADQRAMEIGAVVGEEGAWLTGESRLSEWAKNGGTGELNGMRGAARGTGFRPVGSERYAAK